MGYETRFGGINLGIAYHDYLLRIRSDDLFNPSTLAMTIGARF